MDNIAIYKKMQGVDITVENEYGYITSVTYGFKIKNSEDFLVDANFVDVKDNSKYDIDQDQNDKVYLDGLQLFGGVIRTTPARSSDGYGRISYELDYNNLPFELVGITKYSVEGIPPSFTEEQILKSLYEETNRLNDINNGFSVTYYFDTLIGLYDSSGKLIAYQVFWKKDDE